MSDFPIRWDKQKKEQRDEEHDLKRVKSVIGKIYKKWYTQLTKGQVHPAPLSQHFNDLKARIFQALKDEKLTGFREFTENLLNEKEKEVAAFERANDPAQPNWLLPSTPHAKAVPFHTESQLMELAIVADNFTSPDFAGIVTKVLSRSEIELHALFKDDKDVKAVCLGRLASLKGVQKLPTLREYIAALTKGRAEAALAESSQSSSPSQTSGTSEPSTGADSSKPSAGESGPAGAGPTAS